MGSEIHTLSPQNGINLMSGTMVYGSVNHHELCFADEIQFSNVNPENYELTESNNNRTAPSNILRVPFNVMPPPNKMVNYSKNIEHQRLFNIKFSSTSSKDYESDEGYTSYSSKDAENAFKFNKRIAAAPKEDKDIPNESQIQPGMCRPNLYQPQVQPSSNHVRNNCRFFNSRNRNKPSKHVELTERNVYGLMKRFKNRAHNMKINPNPTDLLNGGPWDQLNQSIWDHFMVSVQKEETYMNKLNLWQSIFLYSRMCLNNYALYLVGSTMTGFALEGSDIDMCLLTKPSIVEPRIDALNHLENLKDVLKAKGLASDPELIRAKVPILKFKNEETGFEVDLSCNNSVGVQNTRLLYCYAQMDWRVRPLVIMVKIWAQANQINDAKNMTISSYSWALMVIHYLQCGVSPPVLPCLHDLYPDKFNSHNDNNNRLDSQEDIEGLNKFESDNTRCLGDLLIGFFHYYSYFNFSEFAISVRTSSLLPIEFCRQVKSPKNDPHQWKYVCIEEPFNFSNTSRSVFNLDVFKHIKRLILLSYKELACHKALSQILPLTLTQINRQK